MRISDWSSDVCPSDLFQITDAPRRFRTFLFDAAELVVRHGGSLSGEHGDGRARSELLEVMYSPAARTALAGFKSLRSEERRVGKECVSRCRSRWLPYH